MSGRQILALAAGAAAVAILAVLRRRLSRRVSLSVRALSPPSPGMLLLRLIWLRLALAGALRLRRLRRSVDRAFERWERFLERRSLPVAALIELACWGAVALLLAFTFSLWSN